MPHAWHDLPTEAVVPMSILHARAIGLMHVEDEDKSDDKVIAMHVHDPAVRESIDLYRRDLDCLRHM